MDQQKKYEFVPGDEKAVAPGRTAKRIRALIAIAALGVAPGELGGYIESEGNLQVSGNAWVSGDAQVSGDARVSGNAQVYGDAQVSGNAWVSGDARVSGDAQVSGDARVESQTDWLLVGPAKSSGRFTTAYRDTKIGVRVSCGCFTGTAQEFSAQIEATHAGNQQHLQQYRLFCQLIALSFDIPPA